MSAESHRPVPARSGEPSSRITGVLQAFVRANHRLEKEEVFEVLYNPRRRYTLQRLAQHGRPHTMDELVERISAKENDVPIGELERQQRRRVHVSLYQTHLPLLDEVGAIGYDKETNTIEPGPALRELKPYLDTPAATQVPWRTYYGRLLAGYVCLGALGLLGVVEVLTLPVLAFGMSVLILAIALVHAVH